MRTASSKPGMSGTWNLTYDSSLEDCRILSLCTPNGVFRPLGPQLGVLTVQNRVHYVLCQLGPVPHNNGFVLNALGEAGGLCRDQTLVCDDGVQPRWVRVWG